MADGKVSVWRRLLDGWTAVAARFGFIQTLVILAFFYVALIGPAAIATFVGRTDPLHKRGIGEDGSAWDDSDSSGADLERAKLTT